CRSKGGHWRGRARARLSADRRDSAGVGRRRLERDVRVQSLRLAPQGAGVAGVADGRGAVDLQGFHNAVARGESCPANQSEGRRRARSREEGIVLRLPVVLGGRADGAHLRAYVAGALGQGRRTEEGEGVLELRGGRALSR